MKRLLLSIITLMIVNLFAFSSDYYYIPPKIWGLTPINGIYYLPISSVNTGDMFGDHLNISFDPIGPINSGGGNWHDGDSDPYPGECGPRSDEGYYLTGGANLYVKSIEINDNIFAYYPVSQASGGNYCNKNGGVCPDWSYNNLYSYGPMLKFSVNYYSYKHQVRDYYDGLVYVRDYYRAYDIYLQFITPDSETSCSNQKHLISFAIDALAVTRWEVSTDTGLNWNPIVNTLPYYYEANPQVGTYLYRVFKTDGTYSPIKQVTYQDPVPSSLIVTPVTNTKTVDETITWSTSATDVTYSYQWNMNGTAIEGATLSTYSIPVIKSGNAGSYSCTVSNGCSSVTSPAATLTVNKAPQVITFPEIAAKTYGDAAFTLPATTDKGLTIIYQSTNSAVATVSGNTVTIVAPGTSNIVASQTGTADYLGATGVTKTLTVNKIAQSISLTSTATKTFGDATFTLPATTDKGKSISYTSSNTAVATVNGNIVTIIGSGTTDLVGTQTGDAHYYAAPNTTQTLTINKAVQTITFGVFASKTYGDAAITLTSTTDKALTISYASSDATVASVSGNILTINKGGTATITATQAGSSNYLPAAPVSQLITINKADQSIAWTNIPNITYGDVDFTLPTTSSKGLTITYTSADPAIATVTGNIVSVKAAGTVNITASQVGTVNYNAANSVTLPLTISKATQSITFPDLPVCNYGDAALILGATSSSGLTVTYESSDNNVATPSGNTLTLGNAGQCYITASVAGNGNYLTTTPVQKQLTVSKANQIISFDAIPDKTYGDAPFSLSALSSNTSMPVTFSSSAPAKLIVSGSTATIAGAGGYTVTASQAGTSNYNAATITRTFTVRKASLIVTADAKNRVYGDANPAFTVSYSGFVNADTRYDLAALPSGSTTATEASTVGDYSISLSTITDANYSLIYRSGIISITQAPLMVTAQAASKIYGDPNPTLTLNYSGFKNGETSAVLSDLPAASTVAKTMSNVGTYDIIVSGGASVNYALNYTNDLLTINKATLKVYASDVSREYGEINPSITMNITGYKGSDDASVLTTLPTESCTAAAISTVGAYDITYSDAEADNYQFDYTSTVGKLTVTKAELIINADYLEKEYGNNNPTLTVSYSGFKNNQTSTALTKVPVVSTTALKTSNAGDYDIVVSGAISYNYSFTYTNAKLTITKATLAISAENYSMNKDEAIPDFTLVYNGFKGSDDVSSLDVLPSVSCSATSESSIGEYEIVLQGGSDRNYMYEFSNGILIVKENTGIDDVRDYNTTLYPIPANDELFIQSDVQISKAEIYSIDGQLMQIEEGTDLKSIDVSDLIKGFYSIRLFSNEKAIVTRLIMKN